MNEFKIGNEVTIPPDYKQVGMIKSIFPHTGRAHVVVDGSDFLIPLDELKSSITLFREDTDRVTD